jgi:hypothetical protein
LENCETSAIGRALANAGYASKGKRPSKEEMVKVARTKLAEPKQDYIPVMKEDDPWTIKTVPMPITSEQAVQTVKEIIGGTTDKDVPRCEHGEMIWKTGQSKAVAILFNNSRTKFNNAFNTKDGEAYQNVDTMVISFELNSPISLNSFSLGSFNPFIFVDEVGKGRGFEIHLAGKTPTDLANPAIFGTSSDGTSIANGSYYKTKNSGSAKKDDFTQITLGDIRQLPIPKIDGINQKVFIKLVNEILTVKEKNQDATIVENQIDQLVYQLYELTDEEIKIIEAS